MSIEAREAYSNMFGITKSTSDLNVKPASLRAPHLLKLRLDHVPLRKSEPTSDQP